MPLDLFIEAEAVKTFKRLKNVLVFGWEGIAKRKKNNKSHLAEWTKQVKEITGIPLTDDKIKIVKWEQEYNVDKASFLENNKSKIQSEFNIYIRMEVR